MKYKHLFFDLDHTLWDFERNSSECLTEIYHGFELVNHGVLTLGDFVRTFLAINTQLWADFDKGRLPHGFIREHRFRLVFEALGIQNLTIGQEMGEEYLRLLPQKSHLLNGAIDLLDYCVAQNYQLHIVTNGFDSIQASKMQSSGIHHYFENVITNEKAGAKKPEARIFEYALTAANAHPTESLMIGDNWEADIMGALRFGIDAAYYNPQKLAFEKTPTYNIQHLEELKSIL
ncbi:MAG: YjjG family noncanonical pyrimidine nucleotidase [Spirosomataceae bacterium]